MQQYCTGAKASMSCLEGEDGNRVFVLELLLHFADISNPYKPFSICEKWADLVVEVGVSHHDCCDCTIVVVFVATGARL